MEMKERIFNEVENKLKALNFEIVSSDKSRPWGGFFVINENQAADFAKLFFARMGIEELNISGKLSPKILLVAPGMRLSWQYHFRRAEIWKVLEGVVGVIKSLTDEETELKEYGSGELIELTQGERHRLVGLKEWGVIAEIWQHTNANSPSDEEDIVRLQDDFGR
ncbi:phosphoheptose isomerase [Pedobacter sp. P351]|uniref:phosphoheptose isomerase n=1 Tax=Pedobacter superstes TaxID=3133441 RepID=UPI0030A87DD8